MKIPYGISSFQKLRRGNYLYVDKTEFIPKIEDLSSDYLFFIRPRRFGKSLFLSHWPNYYDLDTREDFESLFGDLDIGKNPTNSRNSYLILQLNFSGLNTENKDELEKSFRIRLMEAVVGFLYKYMKFFDDVSVIEDRIRKISGISSIFDSFVEELKKTGKKVYLIIDEYDHFANDIIAMGDGVFYKDIVRASGFVRDFYETVKIGTESVIDRIFITGISPIMLDDLTSGFNIATNITLDKNMNEMLGFTEAEVESVISRLGIKRKDIHLKLKEYYNGYLFNVQCRERVYNPDMVLYYFDQFTRENMHPRELIDDNVKTDYGRMNRLTSNKENKKVLERIIEDEGIVSEIITKFSFEEMY